MTPSRSSKPISGYAACVCSHQSFDHELGDGRCRAFACVCYQFDWPAQMDMCPKCGYRTNGVICTKCATPQNDKAISAKERAEHILCLSQDQDATYDQKINAITLAIKDAVKEARWEEREQCVKIIRDLGQDEQRTEDIVSSIRALSEKGV